MANALQEINLDDALNQGINLGQVEGLGEIGIDVNDFGTSSNVNEVSAARSSAEIEDIQSPATSESGAVVSQTANLNEVGAARSGAEVSAHTDVPAPTGSGFTSGVVGGIIGGGATLIVGGLVLYHGCLKPKLKRLAANLQKQASADATSSFVGRPQPF